MITYPDLEPFFVGIVEQFGRPPIRCYDLDKMFAAYQQDGMTYEEAVDHYEYNVRGAWAGEYTPCFIRAPFDLERFDDEAADL